MSAYLSPAHVNIFLFNNNISRCIFFNLQLSISAYPSSIHFYLVLSISRDISPCIFFNPLYFASAYPSSIDPDHFQFQHIAPQHMKNRWPVYGEEM